METPRGMDDLLPEELAIKRRIEDVIREVYEFYGYLEVETPTVEYYELFEAKSGEEIRERMFDFLDKAGRRLVLRPEVTASIARVISTKLKAASLPIRLGYIADCYRYDEPQWGRRRRFWQGGFELFGSREPLADAEILQASHDVFEKLGLKNQYFKAGHVGVLRGILGGYKVEEETQDRILTLIDRNRVGEALGLMNQAGVDEEGRETILRLTQLIGENIREIISKASDIVSSWKEAEKSLENLGEIIELAVEGGVKSKIIVSPGFARGLEYYTGFIFEQAVPGSKVSLNGGGRYDRLVELFGGKPPPGVGCAIGITRIMHYLLDKQIIISRPHRPRVLLVSAPGVTDRYLARVARIIRSAGIPVEVEVMKKKIPAAIEFAVKNGMKFLIIVGGREEESETVAIRNLEEKTQIEISLREVERIREELEK